MFGDGFLLCSGCHPQEFDKLSRGAALEFATRRPFGCAQGKRADDG